MSLREPHKKMSKSQGVDLSRIHLDDNSTDVAKKIRKAVTDSMDGVSYEVNGQRPGLKNLLDIHTALSGQPIPAILERYQSSSTSTTTSTATNATTATTREFKEELAHVVVQHLTPIQERLRMLQADPQYVDRILERGAEQARAVASAKYRQVWDVVARGTIGQEDA